MARSPGSSPTPEVFDAPRAPEGSDDGLWRLGRFVLQRGLRVGAAVLVLVLVALFVLGPNPTPLALAAVCALSLALWTPTTVVLFRTQFFPAPGDPRLRASDGLPRNPRDVILDTRARAAEHVLGSLPLMVAGLFATTRLGPLGIGAGGLSVLIVLAAVSGALHTMEHQVARVEGAIDQSAAADRRLSRLLPITFGERRDALLHSLARLRFRGADIDGALQALGRIRDKERFAVAPLTAQIVVGRDPDRALRALTQPGLSEAEAALVESLADLHTGRAALVHDRSDALEALCARAAPDVASVLCLTLAAASAADAPDRARGFLDAGGWTRDRLPWLHAVWPGVAEPLEALERWATR